jgi:hypothetical protein
VTTDRDEQMERLKQFHNDRLVRRVGTTMADLTGVVSDDVRGGRYAPPSRKPEAPPTYPHQPPNSPYSADPVGLEPPLGYSIEDQPVVGEPHEVAEAARVMASREVEATLGPLSMASTETTDVARQSASSPGDAAAVVSPPMKRRV